MKDVTLTLTIGRRPDLLTQTLDSLLQKTGFAEIVAINDFGDEETNQVFRRLCPEGKLLSPTSSAGHHAAIDRLYSEINTPYVFHCEDDWLFETAPDLHAALNLLNENRALTSVCFRKVTDFGMTDSEASGIDLVETNVARYCRLDGLDSQWHGYTFNPHLISVTTLAQIARFSKFKKERHISRWLRKQGRYVAYLDPGCCRHIGMDCSVSIRPSLAQRIKNKFKQWANNDA